MTLLAKQIMEDTKEGFQLQNEINKFQPANKKIMFGVAGGLSNRTFQVYVKYNNELIEIVSSKNYDDVLSFLNCILNFKKT